jgi:hypothetical protein
MPCGFNRDCDIDIKHTINILCTFGCANPCNINASNPIKDKNIASHIAWYQVQPSKPTGQKRQVMH